MKKFEIVAAQGEITIIRIGKAKRGKKFSGSPMEAERGRYIIGHSETGHHHVIEAKGATVTVLDRAPEGMRILRAVLEETNALIHLRDHDTHKPIQLDGGYEYEFRIGREYDPYAEIARRQAD